ncbi:MAG: hypothetical protein M3Y60_03415 [Bacteroidota bacterium]|nr:hypothetical protein [Bacteroidota bacterium]
MRYLSLCLAFFDAGAQSTSLQMGARGQAMGNASACLSDVWSITRNVAGLASVKSPGFAATYHPIPSFTPFNRTAAVVALPLKSGVLGASVFRFGDDLYSEQIASMAFANSYGLASLGLKANAIQYRAEGLETRTAFTLSFGGIAALTPQLSIGAHIVNINQPVINERTGDRLPTRLTAGISLKLSTSVTTAMELEKDLQNPPVMKSGIEYKVFEKLAFRTGFNLHPQAGFFGIGGTIGRLQLDYALQLADAFGLSHQATVTFALQKP